VQSYILHLEWDSLIPCRDGICDRAAPIVASDSAETASVVIGVTRVGCARVGHDGLNAAVEAVEKPASRRHGPTWRQTKDLDDEARARS
jgi:hypothetical protein